MTVAMIAAIFVVGMFCGAWKSWKYLPRVIEVAAVVPVAPALEYVPPVVEETPVVPIVGGGLSMTRGDRPLFISPGGIRYHTQSNCFGLRNAGRISTKTACRLCAADGRGVV